MIKIPRNQPLILRNTKKTCIKIGVLENKKIDEVCTRWFVPGFHSSQNFVTCRWEKSEVDPSFPERKASRHNCRLCFRFFSALDVSLWLIKFHTVSFRIAKREVTTAIKTLTTRPPWEVWKGAVDVLRFRINNYFFTNLATTVWIPQMHQTDTSEPDTGSWRYFDLAVTGARHQPRMIHREWRNARLSNR